MNVNLFEFNIFLYIPILSFTCLFRNLTNEPIFFLLDSNYIIEVINKDNDVLNPVQLYIDIQHYTNSMSYILKTMYWKYISNKNHNSSIENLIVYYDVGYFHTGFVIVI